VQDAINNIQKALGTIQQTLDWLTERGHEKEAFEIAKFQFAANIRASWPGNLAPMARLLEKLVADQTLTLSSSEREQIKEAANVLHSMIDI
jgi:hypothetical protein